MIFIKIVGNLWNGVLLYISIEECNYLMFYSLNKRVVKLFYKLIFRVLDFFVFFEMGFIEFILEMFVDWFSWIWRLFLFGFREVMIVFYVGKLLKCFNLLLIICLILIWVKNEGKKVVELILSYFFWLWGKR